MIKALLAVCLLLSYASNAFAQDLAKAEQLALGHARKSLSAKPFSSEDLRDLAVDHSYVDERLGITYVYLQQRIGSVPIEAAVASIAIKGDHVYSFTQRFVSELSAHTASVVPALNDNTAVAKAFTFLGQAAPLSLQRKAEGVVAAGQRRYDAPEAVHSDLVVQDVYKLDEKGQLHRAFAVSIDLRKGDFHRVFVDARTGEILYDQVLTQHCSFDKHFAARQYANIDGECDPSAADLSLPQGVKGLRHPDQHSAYAKTQDVSLADGARYRVYAWPAESPSHGAHQLVVNPSDEGASPYGWHDTNGAAGPEFTYTRGNNTHAYADLTDVDEPTEIEPEGGASLTFDFPFNVANEPVSQLNATTTNLFYAVNMMHDFAWHYGFDEPAGNFQQRNYTGRGQGGDYVLAQSEDGARTLVASGLPDADHLNNANFSTPVDGASGRMQMYLWNANASGNPVTIASPAGLAGRDYGQLGLPAAGEWGPGAYVDSTTNVVASIHEVVDISRGSGETDGCDNYVDPTAVRGKIAIIDRGICQFGLKAFKAQQNGAIAVIICNFEDALLGMAAGENGEQVNIPTFMMQQSGCVKLRLDARNNADFRLQIRRPNRTGPAYLSGSLDNGIVAHEFGHGISTRLTGGPNVSCLGNAEQMGEGWSDFFTLVTSVRAGDRPEMQRGIGTFVERQPNDGAGIRPYPYSTDMLINPVTYEGVADVSAFSQPHGIGSIWASMLWDLHWNMVDRYGFSDNLFGDTLGNNKAIQLVMTGMKLQPCDPGFVDGRDAILRADNLLYGGANQKLIWETFARRGLGADADQGDADDRTDGVVGFQLPLEIADRIFFTKTVTKNVDPGQKVEVNLVLANFIDSVAVLPSVKITDVIPAGAQLVTGSLTIPYTLNGDVLAFDFRNVAKGDSIEITYEFVAPSTSSTLYWHEPLDALSDDNNFDRYNQLTASSFFEVAEDFGFGDNVSYEFVALNEATQPILEIFEEREFVVQGANPMFSFYHQYNIAPGVEAGIVEIYDASRGDWLRLPADKLVRNGYNSPVSYQSFVIPFLRGWSGSQLGDWEQVLVDLRDYAGKTIRLRWRFGRGDVETGAVGDGWFIDEFAQIDAIAFNTEASVIIGASTQRFKAEDVGTLMNYGGTVGTSEAIPDAVRFKAFPNPTNRNLTLEFEQSSGEGLVELFSLTGQRLNQQTILAGDRRVMLSLQDQAPGIYALRVEREGAVQVLRIVRQ